MTTKIAGFRLPAEYIDKINALKQEINDSIPFAADTNTTVVMRAICLYEDVKPHLRENRPNLNQKTVVMNMDEDNLSFIRQAAKDKGISDDALINSIIHQYRTN